MASESNQTKAQRREAARAEAAALRAEQERRDKRVRLITIGVLVVAVAGLIAVFFFVLNNSDDPAPTPGADSTVPGSSTAAPTVAVDTNGGIPVGKTDEAGTSTEGAPQLDVYLDFMCPNCGQFEQINEANFDALREAGELTLVLHPISILDRLSQGTAFSTRAAAASGFVAERDPTHFLAFNSALFQNQPKENSKGLTNARMGEIAAAAGVSTAVADGIASGEAMEQFGGWVVDQTEQDASDKKNIPPEGLQGTPTVILDGKALDSRTWADPAALKAAIEAAAKN